MPQTKKWGSCAGVSGQVSVQDQGESPPLPDVRSHVAALGVAAEDWEDPEIIKSPSDPKKYRCEGTRQAHILDKVNMGCLAGTLNRLNSETEYNNATAKAHQQL